MHGIIMATYDFNGTGIWDAQAIVARYHAYAEQYSVSPTRNVDPQIHESGENRWIYPVMDKIIDGIKAGDLACAQLGVEFICEDQGFKFGSIIKSGTARALRQFQHLTAEQVATIRTRIVGMLVTGTVPREFQSYSRLLRKIGFGEYWPQIVSATPKNRYAARAHAYFLRHCAPVS